MIFLDYAEINNQVKQPNRIEMNGIDVHGDFYEVVGGD